MCKKLITKTLPFWRKYWSEMLPLKNLSDEINNYDNCWDDLRKIGKPYAIEICKWDGWHWILKAQLEMFFGLKSEHIIEK